MPRKPATTAEPNGDLRRDVDALMKRVESLEASRPGRKAKPMIALRQHDVCAIDPDRDSTTCEDASIFRYQMGCHGALCRAKQHESYVRRKNRRTAAPVKAPATKKAAVKKTVKVPAKKIAAAKKAAPTKRPARAKAVALAQ